MSEGTFSDGVSHIICGKSLRTKGCTTWLKPLVVDIIPSKKESILKRMNMLTLEAIYLEYPFQK